MTSRLRRFAEAAGGRLAQGLLDAIQRTDSRRVGENLKRGGMLRLRAVLVRRFDPPVVARIGKLEMRVPFSHDLPVIQSVLPQYSRNLARLARAVHDKYPHLTAIDVGANVGDSAYLIRSVSTAPILCVEGDLRYLSYLRHNMNSLPSVEIEPSFVGAASGKVKGVFTAASGTGRIIPDDTSADAVSVRSLCDIVASHPSFMRSKLLKIDTDGFEAEILLGNEEYLERVRPILFFEYSPDLLNEKGPQLFSLLRATGYFELIVYENTGDYLLTARLDDHRLVEDIHAYYRGRGADRYVDIAAFHAEDRGLVQLVREGELAISQQQRLAPVRGSRS